jgi:hypothetical protein
MGKNFPGVIRKLAIELGGLRGPGRRFINYNCFLRGRSTVGNIENLKG